MTAVSKVTLNGTTLMDATSATASASEIISPYTAMTADGVMTTGTASGGGSSPWTNDETILASGTWSSETTGWTLTPTGITLGTLRKYRYILLNVRCATSTSVMLRVGSAYLFQTGQGSTQPQCMIEFLDSNHKFYKWGQCFDALSSDADSKIFWEVNGTLSGDYPAYRELKRCIRLGGLPSTLSDSTEVFLQNNVAQTGAGAWQIRGAIEE